MQRKAKTRLVTFKPYAHRAECCAVALLVWDDCGNVTAHAAHQLRKAKALDPSCDIEKLRMILDRMAQELTSRPESLGIYESGFGGLSVSEDEGYFIYSSQEQFEEGLHWAMAVSVEPVKATPQRERVSTSRLFLEVKTVFNNLKWIAAPGQGLSAHRIIPRYGLAPDEGLVVDFALQNGALNCLQTIDYRLNPGQKVSEANGKILTLGMAPHLVAGDTRSMVLIAGSAADEAKRAIKLAERVASDIFIHESATDMDRLMDHMSRSLGQMPLPSLPMG